MYFRLEHVAPSGWDRTDLKVGTCGLSMFRAWEARPLFSGQNGGMVRGARMSKGHPVCTPLPGDTPTTS